MSILSMGRPVFGYAEKAAKVEGAAEQAASLNKEAIENWTNPVWHAEKAAEIVRFIDETFEADNTLAQFFRTTTVGEFDRVVKKKRSGIKAFWTHRGGYIDESGFGESEVEVPRDSVGFHVREFDDKVRSNYAAWLPELTQSGYKAIETEITRRVVTVLAEASPVGSAQHIAGGATLTPQVLNAAIDAVADAPRTGGVGADAQVSIVGRRSALSALLDFTGYAQEAQEEIRKRGLLGLYRGAQIITLPNQLDETGQPFISDKEVFVLTRDVGEVVKYGAIRGNSWTENTATYHHSQARAEVGVLVDQPHLLRRITLT